MPQTEGYEATDLLTNKKEIISLLPYKATETSLAAHGAKILKIIF
jgi:hypothetical protein